LCRRLKRRITLSRWRESRGVESRATEAASASTWSGRASPSLGADAGRFAMTPLLISALCLTIVATSFLSGLFGMAGGMILMGILIAIMPLPAAMVLHAVTQMASNGWRALLWWRHIRWRPVGFYLLGSALALVTWSFILYVPSKPIALIFLGLTPFLLWLPAGLKPDPESRLQAAGYGLVSMVLMLMAGVSGPLIDSFFLGGRLDRREIIASKAICQVVSHGMKLVYFGGLIVEAASLDPLLAALAIGAAMFGTTLAKRFLQMMTDTQFRTWATRLIAVIGGCCVIQGAYLLVVT
jgi:uncharacterized membrane protein YfcA